MTTYRSYLTTIFLKGRTLRDCHATGRMARFIIADLTDPSSIPQELQAIIPSVRRTCSTAAPGFVPALCHV